MRAYLLDDPTRSIAPDDLAKRGVLSWQVPADEPARQQLIDAVKREHHYIDEDVVALSPELPNLDEVSAKFDKEHYHTEDEVRLVLGGEGIFDVRDDSDQWIRIEVATGDMIVIPARTHHRFFLTDAKQIRCMRLFANNEGWAPVYRA